MTRKEVWGTEGWETVTSFFSPGRREKKLSV